MTVRLVLAVAGVIVTVLVARLVDRRRTPVRPATATVPAQLDRADFPHPDAPWLVVLFSSATCAGCGPMREKVAPLASAEVAVAEVEFAERPDLHRRYAIEAVPLVVVADAEGVTRAAFAGAASAPDLWAEVARLRG